ncbi:MAG: hypothetical protein ACMUIE_06520 [Thermoplasmatota archaeon]
MDATTIWIIVAIAALVIAVLLVISLIVFLVRRRKGRPSHVQLYFDENFRKIMDEWDMVTRDRVKDFKKDLNKRLSLVGSDIDLLEKNRTKLDRRLGALDREMTRMEGL